MMTGTGTADNHGYGRMKRLAGRCRVRYAVRPLAVLVLATITACTPVSHFIGGEPSPERVFSAGYENVFERYIDPVDLRKVALSGLNSLIAMDPDLQIDADEKSVRLLAGNVVAGAWVAPHRDDTDGWARISAEIVDVGRVHSVILRSRSNEDVYTAVFEGVLTRFDRYSRYASAKSARRRQVTRQGFGGLGISINYNEGLTSIIEVHPDTPAAEAGLKVKDVITHVDGRPIDGLPQRGVVDLLRGPVDSRVELTVDRPGVETPVLVAVVRGLIILPTVRAKLEDDVLTLKISGFNQGTASTARRHIAAARRVGPTPIKGIILDFRGNPGGLLDQSVRLADLFLEDGLIVSTKGRHHASEQIFDASSGAIAKKTPLIVLINGKSASAAEIVAGALRDRGRAVVLGSSSYGKGSVQTVLGLPNGGELTLTWARLMTPAGLPLQKHGVVPSICTNGSGKDADEIKGMLRSILAKPGKGQLAQLGAAKPALNGHDADRADCPPDSDRPEIDMEIARFILSDSALYNRVVANGHRMVAAK